MARRPAWPEDTVFRRLVLDVESDSCEHCGATLHVCDHRFHRIHTLQGPVELPCRLAHCSDCLCPLRCQTLRRRVVIRIFPPSLPHPPPRGAHRNPAYRLRPHRPPHRTARYWPRPDEGLSPLGPNGTARLELGEDLGKTLVHVGPTRPHCHRTPISHKVLQNK